MTPDVKHKAIVFSDFDGTITLTDSNDFLVDTIGFGREQRRQLNAEIIADRLSFRQAFHDMLSSVAANQDFDECQRQVVAHIQLDPGFKVFYEWCQAHDIPVIILSSGMEPLIRALLATLLGSAGESIPIVANEVDIRTDGGWEIVFHDDSHFGHDKSLVIKKYRAEREKLPEAERPVFFYCGDGVSDLSAARETELLFAKAGHDLITYCEKEDVPYTPFRDFSCIQAEVQKVVEGRKSVADIAENR